MEAMVADDFKPNSALIVLDFLIRHGIVNTENGNNLNSSNIIYFLTCVSKF